MKRQTLIASATILAVTAAAAGLCWLLFNLAVELLTRPPARGAPHAALINE